MIGIGGGGDIVGALAIGRLCESLGTGVVLGGVAWERFAVDPKPGPRPLAEIVGTRPLSPTSALAGPGAATDDGVPLCEGRMAEHLGAETVLIDVTRGAAGAAEGIAAAARALDCDLAIHVDVGGDLLAHGDEPGLASPLCDAVMLAGVAAGNGPPGLGAVFGPGCDGELTADEVLERVAALGRAGAWLGTAGLTPPVADELEAAARLVTTEASLMAVRCARGETGPVGIRDGRRRVVLGPVGALTFFFDPGVAVERAVAPLAGAVAGTADIEAARRALAALGVRTELDYERERAAEPR